MPTDDELFGPGRLRAFSPFLAPAERKKLHAALGLGSQLPASFAEELRALARRYIDDGDSAKLRAVCLLVADLYEQGWQVAVQKDRITFQPPGIARAATETVDDVKARVRAALQIGRSRQLREPSVRQFLVRMERPTHRPQGTTSVLDLIDDGAALAKAFKKIAKLPTDQQDHELSKLVDPIVEVCEAGAKCTDTGLNLIDIWRYFRHTWAHEYRSIPGRQMLVLVRNAARPRRPIMGIAMLSSPVMRLGPRDHWIGWTREAAEEKLNSNQWNQRDFARSLRERIAASIKSIRWDDLASKDDIASPTDAVVLRLEQKATGAAFARERELRKYYKDHCEQNGAVRPHRGELRAARPDADWKAASEDLLFVRKRAEGLAQLLFAKRVFQAAGLSRKPAKALDTLFASSDGRRALDIVFAEFRKAGLSSAVADVSVCGAVHPYNQLLAGKLVALLLTSREVQNAYAKRYGGQISFIASQMAGRRVSKPAKLSVLTTTSLYGVGSSQYNRLALRSSDHVGLAYDIIWGAIGKSLTGGFGTLHLGRDTAQALRSMAIARHDSRRVNNRFGEGTSPRLRQIREGLDALGLKSDTILHHATPRIFYGCELTPNARRALLGFHVDDIPQPTVRDVAAAWRKRWLAKRMSRKETIEALPSFGITSVRASLHAESDGQFVFPFDSPEQTRLSIP